MKKSILFILIFFISTYTTLFSQKDNNEVDPFFTSAFQKYEAKENRLSYKV